MKQELRFCTAADGVRIAYATMGSGPPLVKAANWLSHLEYDLESPFWQPWLRELSRDHTLIRYDERGCGLSDWDADDYSHGAWVQDLEAVVDAAGVDRFALLGISQGGSVAIEYAIRHPERVTHLILYGSYARGWRKRAASADEIKEREAVIELSAVGWGRDMPAYREIFTRTFIPDANEEQRNWFNELQRKTCSPENAVRLQQTTGDIDVVALLPKVNVPTLVLHARGDLRCPIDESRVIAAGIRNSRFVSLESHNHLLLADEPAFGVFLSEVRAFLGVETTPSILPKGSLLQTLKQRKVVQWSFAYLAGAWALLQVLEFLVGQFGWPADIVRGATVFLAINFLSALVLAWYHGERGAQRMSFVEVALLLVIVLTSVGAAILIAPADDLQLQNSRTDPIGWTPLSLSPTIIA